MATHSRILALEIPWTEEPGRCLREVDTFEQLSLSLLYRGEKFKDIDWKFYSQGRY